MTRHDALLFLARCLAAGAIAPGDIAWERLVEVASEYWMTLALAWELREQPLPADLLEYFQIIRDGNAARNQGILQHAGELARMLNRIGVEPVLLKGVAHLASGLYPDPALRFMSDIDILVPDDREPECRRLLLASGYAMCKNSDALVREGFIAEVELHHPSEWEYVTVTNSPALYLDTEPVSLGGAKARILNATSRMVFTLAHSYVQHAPQVRTHPPLRDLYDVTLMMRKFGREIAWPQVVDAFRAAGQMEALRTACMMWRRLLPPGPPIEIEPPRWAELYWQCCTWEIRRPAFGLIGERLVRAAQGREMRRMIASPSLFWQKLRTAAQLAVGGESSEGKWR